MMCFRLFAVIAVLCLAFAGCTADQIAKMDKAVGDANSVAAGGQALVQSPAGGLLPPIVAQIVQVAFVLVTAVAGWWGKNKYQLLKQTAGTVVKSIESLPTEQQAPVLEAVGSAMTATAADSTKVTYAQMNAVVDKLKAE